MGVPVHIQCRHFSSFDQYRILGQKLAQKFKSQSGSSKLCQSSSDKNQQHGAVLMNENVRLHEFTDASMIVTDELSRRHCLLSIR